MKRLIVLGACSAMFVIVNQIAVGLNIIDPFLYFVGLIGGGAALVLSVGEIFVIKATERLNEIEQENENTYEPKL
jgi:hypothetical protein